MCSIVCLTGRARCQFRRLRDPEIEHHRIDHEPPAIEGCGVITRAAHDPDGNAAARAAGPPERILRHMRIGKERVDGGGEDAHQTAEPLRRTAPRISVAPDPTAAAATPMRVLSVSIVVASEPSQ